MGQVTHALLTRPPLSQMKLPPEEIRFKCFARLACVKHAASVHPEPGSNSLIKCAHQDFHALALVKIVRSPSRFLCEVCSSSRSTNQLIYPFYCFKGSFDRFEFNFSERSRMCFTVQLSRFVPFGTFVPASAATRSFYHNVLCLSRTFLKTFFAAVRRFSVVLSELLKFIIRLSVCQALFKTFFIVCCVQNGEGGI